MQKIQFVSVDIPEQYVEPIRAALMQVYQRLLWDAREVYGVLDLPVLTGEDLLQTPMAATLATVAHAAAGLAQHSEYGDGELMEAMQAVMEWLFATPLMTAYQIPDAFWETDLGAMVARAQLWLRGDTLITLKEAAELLGVSPPAVTQMCDAGKLTVYHNPDARNPQREARLVARGEVEKLKATRE